MNQDILSSLRDLREQLQDRLLDLPEYRALSAIEKAIADVTEMMDKSPMRTFMASVAPAPVLAPVPDSRPDPMVASNVMSASTGPIARRIDVAHYFPRHHVG